MATSVLLFTVDEIDGIRHTHPMRRATPIARLQQHQKSAGKLHQPYRSRESVLCSQPMCMSRARPRTGSDKVNWFRKPRTVYVNTAE